MTFLIINITIICLKNISNYKLDLESNVVSRIISILKIYLHDSFNLNTKTGFIYLFNILSILIIYLTCFKYYDDQSIVIKILTMIHVCAYLNYLCLFSYFEIVNITNFIYQIISNYFYLSKSMFNSKNQSNTKRWFSNNTTLFYFSNSLFKIHNKNLFDLDTKNTKKSVKDTAADFFYSFMCFLCYFVGLISGVLFTSMLLNSDMVDCITKNNISNISNISNSNIKNSNENNISSNKFNTFAVQNLVFNCPISIGFGFVAAYIFKYVEEQLYKSHEYNPIIDLNLEL
jgi:hypothetical protein